jgi:L-fuculose-phosphate aldolase
MPDKKLSPKYLKFHKEEIIQWSQRLYQRGILQGFEGNISLRLGKEYVLITRSLCDKKNLTMDDMALTNMAGDPIPGFQEKTVKASREFLIHSEIYRRSPETRAVVHAHPAHGILLTILNWQLDAKLLPEVMSYLNEVPIAETTLPGSINSAEALRPHLPQCKAILMKNHGAVTHGADLTVAGCLMEMVEKFSYIYFHAYMLKKNGNISHLPEEIIEFLKNKTQN